MPFDSLTFWLPDELAVNIFRLVLDEAGFSSYSDYARARIDLCKLSKGWMLLIFRTPLFWNKIRVSLFHPAAAPEHIARVGDTIHLHMRLEIKDVELYVRQYGEDHDLHATLDDALEAVVSTVHRWRSLYVVTDNGTCLEQLRIHLLPFAPPTLRSFTLVFRRLLVLHGTLLYGPDNIPAPGSPTNWFQSLPPHFSSLRLRCIGFNLQTQGLTGLCRLELEMVHPSFYPTFDDYAHIIRGCTRLYYLRLRWVGCEGIDARGDETLFSSSICDLDIGFCTVDSLARLVAKFRFPNLHTVRLETTSTLGLVAATLAAPFLANFFFLQIETDTSSTDFFTALRNRLPHVDLFDLTLPARLHHLNSLLAYFNPVPSGSFQPSPLRQAAHDRTLAIQLPSASSIDRADDNMITALCSSFTSFTLVPGNLDTLPDLESIWAVRLS
ncbi:hypothetical protein C8J57DRAFT_117809 [Mycena rebaudengoi]|nr:hypothetical protein C8J57DRAFT_117809 [Mycena rebaudengoi]